MTTLLRRYRLELLAHINRVRREGCAMTRRQAA